jgi:hypothetical protein
MSTPDNYPAWAITRALERGYDHPAHIRALYANDVDAISLTHPYNWLTEQEAEVATGKRICTSDDPTNHQGGTCPVHEGDETTERPAEPTTAGRPGV